MLRTGRPASRGCAGDRKLHRGLLLRGHGRGRQRSSAIAQRSPSRRAEMAESRASGDGSGGGEGERDAHPRLLCLAASAPDHGDRLRREGTLVIHGTGDVSLDPSQIPAFRTQGYDWAWSGLDGLFRRDDLTMVNLECPATDIVDPEPKAFTFRCDPLGPPGRPTRRRRRREPGEQPRLRSRAGGSRGLFGRIRAAGLASVGAGVDERRRSGPRGSDRRLDGRGRGDRPGPRPGRTRSRVRTSRGRPRGHDFRLALRAVRDAAASSDLVFVMIHWGSSSKHGRGGTRFARPTG